MQLVLAGSQENYWRDVAKDIAKFFPNLIRETDFLDCEISSTDIYDVEEEAVEKIKPTIDKIVLVTLNHPLNLHTDNDDSFLGYKSSSFIGGYYVLPNLMRCNRMKKDYLVKVGIEEILHCFHIPKHNRCFYHNDDSGLFGFLNEEYCRRCKRFGEEIGNPNDWARLELEIFR